MLPPEFVTLTDAAAKSSVRIAPARGAIVTSFSVNGSELLYLDAATYADPSKNVRGGVPILFPFPGKLAGDTWHRNGLQGTMPQHGFARQLAWTVDSPQTPSGASMSLASSAVTLRQYPWPFHATLTGASLRTTLRVRNSGDSPLPYALGFHPYFQVRDKSSIEIRTHATRAYNNVSKQLESFAGFDFTAPEVDIHLVDHGSDVAALNLGDGSVIAVRASEDFGVWVIWSLMGKEFVCLEPWTAPGDALNTGEGLITLAPGATHESWMEIEYTKTMLA
jgi:galactose mutarotase-like enzyme